MLTISYYLFYSGVKSAFIEHKQELIGPTICKTFPGLSKDQIEICHQYPDVTSTAMDGLQLAIEECQYQFQWHRWNCSSLSTKNKNPHSNVLLQRGKSQFPHHFFFFVLLLTGIFKFHNRRLIIHHLGLIIFYREVFGNIVLGECVWSPRGDSN